MPPACSPVNAHVGRAACAAPVRQRAHEAPDRDDGDLVSGREGQAAIGTASAQSDGVSRVCHGRLDRRERGGAGGRVGEGLEDGCRDRRTCMQT